MTTELLAEDRPVTAFALVRGTASTLTGAETLEVQPSALTESRSGSHVSWEIIDTSPPQDSRIGQAVYRFAKAVWRLPGVVAMTHAKDGNVNLIWTFIAHRDKSLRKQVYACERELMSKYPDLLFDFNVLSLDQGEHGSLVPDDLQGRLVMYRPAR
ncbi:MAG: hypothetical protein HY726_07520 [Candidatus Rokubacteria bacterium]|nr:hypothetical protein [Candidatus Rokubacteria bacterium]